MRVPRRSCTLQLPVEGQVLQLPPAVYAAMLSETHCHKVQYLQLPPQQAAQRVLIIPLCTLALTPSASCHYALCFFPVFVYVLLVAPAG